MTVGVHVGCKPGGYGTVPEAEEMVFVQPGLVWLCAFVGVGWDILISLGQGWCAEISGTYCTQCSKET